MKEKERESGGGAKKIKRIKTAEQSIDFDGEPRGRCFRERCRSEGDCNRRHRSLRCIGRRFEDASSIRDKSTAPAYRVRSFRELSNII
ncbi:hypothetical protein EYF80_056770 [Liparis tanakae]|uniref:Uncharacterized protein n=1 Tax=Liparis tanakae TaxID=230148 RepID=A0A4Z2EVT2_9TELE|nr:hypothetical protein EYF80_056770 [Liparis tanakae]